MGRLRIMKDPGLQLILLAFRVNEDLVSVKTERYSEIKESVVFTCMNNVLHLFK